MNTLKSTLAGAWYPGTEREIRAMAATEAEVFAELETLTQG